MFTTQKVFLATLGAVTLWAPLTSFEWLMVDYAQLLCRRRDHQGGFIWFHLQSSTWFLNAKNRSFTHISTLWKHVDITLTISRQMDWCYLLLLLFEDTSANSSWLTWHWSVHLVFRSSAVFMYRSLVDLCQLLIKALQWASSGSLLNILALQTRHIAALTPQQRKQKPQPQQLLHYAGATNVLKAESSFFPVSLWGRKHTAAIRTAASRHRDNAVPPRRSKTV